MRKFLSNALRNFMDVMPPVILVMMAVTLLIFSALTIMSDNPLHLPEKSVVMVSRDLDLERGFGSGVHVGNGLFLTAQHVVGDNEVMYIGEDKLLVLYVDPQRDLALLGNPLLRHKYATPFVSCVSPDVGDHYTMWGYPTILGKSMFQGFVASREPLKGKAGKKLDYIWVGDGTIGPGNSGGPVFDDDDFLVGIAVGGPLMSVPGWPPSRTDHAAPFMVTAENICDFLDNGPLPEPIDDTTEPTP